MTQLFPGLRRAAMAAALGATTAACAQGLPAPLFLPEAVLPRQTIEASPYPIALKTARPRAPIAHFTYSFKGETKSLDSYLAEAKVRSLLVLKDGKIVYEYNRFPYTSRSLHQSWSIGKQVLSAAVGVALAEGAIRSVDDRMDAYDPSLALNGFAGVTFKQALQMSSGVGYDEEADRFKLFLDVITDFYTLGVSGRDLSEKTFDVGLKNTYASGSRYQYASINSQAISSALEKAVGMPYQKYIERKLWQRMGMPDDAKVLVDRKGNAFTLCCLYATTRSYATFGLMYARGGELNGRQVLPREWVTRATTLGGDPGNWANVPREGNEFGLYGFGYHWWPLSGDRGDFSALGVFGQAIHVLPAQDVVIVRMSGDFDTPGAHAEENAIMGRALADYLSAP